MRFQKINKVSKFWGFYTQGNRYFSGTKCDWFGLIGLKEPGPPARYLNNFGRSVKIWTQGEYGKTHSLRSLVITLETSEEDSKVHSKRVKKIRKYTPNECNFTFRLVLWPFLKICVNDHSTILGD
jgi:hypothetical protein